MSYQTFYRKYRPSDLDDISGQKAIVKIIKNSLKLNRISHAYLFYGPRGTGKTTLARILAKNVNCLNLEDGIACGKCKNCLSILNGNCPDIIELDAASNNGVDEIREIKNKVSLVPTELKYKVYVIDEVHMLSIGAFNALLKTLEEPPEHVIFILATTDIHKVPITIISRCQCLDFHRVCEEDLVNRLSHIVKLENIDIEPEILRNIANVSDGGFRDAIGMLDKLVSYTNGKIILSDFEELNGVVSLNKKRQFLKIIENKDIQSVIQFIDDIYNDGKDLILFSQDLMILCRDLIIDYYSYEDTNYDIEFLLSFVEKVNELVISLKEASNMRILFETRILSFIYQNGLSGNKTLKNQFTQENSFKNGSSVEKQDVIISSVENDISREESSVDKSDDSEFYRRNAIIVNNCFCNASKKNLNFIRKYWGKLSDYALDSKYGAVACYLSDATVRAASDHEIIITFSYESVVTRGFRLSGLIEELLYKILGDSYYVSFLTEKQWNIEKNRYIENKNSGNHYVYQSLDLKDDSVGNHTMNSDFPSSESIADEAIKLFGENIVSVNE